MKQSAAESNPGLRSSSRLARLANGAERYLDRAVMGLTGLAAHEAEALRGHWIAVGERLAVARRARSASELLRDQFDLLPESRARLRRAQRQRSQLVRGLMRELTKQSGGNAHAE